MKKHLIILSILFIITVTAIAQENEFKSKFILGSTINYNSSNFNNRNEINKDTPIGVTINSNIQQLNATFYIGMNINQNGLAGIIGLVERSKSHYIRNGVTSTSITDQVNRRIGIGLFYRHYFKLKSTFQLYAQPTLSYSKSKSAPNVDYFDTTDTYFKFTQIDVDLNFGAQYRIHPRWNILINIWNIKYQNNKEEVGLFTRQEHILDFSFSIRDIRLGGEFIF